VLVDPKWRAPGPTPRPEAASLALEAFLQFFEEAIHVDRPCHQGGPPANWKPDDFQP